ncbi:MAG: SGNH/GDSL hydrolase family protein [Gammaproteobacteria bacterium]|nr:MAG: SGNH/GDSL hydrolase family protein [Gammaproteobacteria bacterium]
MRNWLLVPVSITVLLLFMELGLRVAGYNPLGNLVYNDRAAFIQPSVFPKRIYEGVPFARGRAWGADVELNSLGLRDSEYPLDAAEGVKRIVVIGDSVTFGNYMQQQDVYVEVLERHFRNRGQNVEVINMGLGGYDTLQEVATLEHIGLQFKPDLVIVGFCVNDIGVASGNLDYVLQLKEYGKTSLYRWRIAQLVRVQIDRIRLGREMMDANKAERFAEVYGDYSVDVTSDATLMALRAGLGQPNGNDSRFSFSNLYTSVLNLGRVRYAMESLRQIADREDFPVLVMIVPFLKNEPENHETWQTIYRMIEHEVNRVGLAHYTPYPEFGEYGFDRLTQRKNDFIHPNAEGHRLMAEGLYQQIMQEGWLFPVSPGNPAAASQ